MSCSRSMNRPADVINLLTRWKQQCSRNRVELYFTQKCSIFTKAARTSNISQSGWCSVSLWVEMLSESVLRQNPIAVTSVNSGSDTLRNRKSATYLRQCFKKR